MLATWSSERPISNPHESEPNGGTEHGTRENAEVEQWDGVKKSVHLGPDANQNHEDGRYRDREHERPESEAGNWHDSVLSETLARFLDMRVERNRRGSLEVLRNQYKAAQRKESRPVYQ